MMFYVEYWFDFIQHPHCGLYKTGWGSLFCFVEGPAFLEAWQTCAKFERLIVCLTAQHTAGAKETPFDSHNCR
jgi:hypothetical protein